MAKSTYFEIIESQQTQVIALHLAADLDIASFNEINKTLIDEWPIPRDQDVIVDLSASKYMGSVLLGLLINIRQRTRAGNGELVVCGAPSELTRVFKTSNLERLIELVGSRKDALARLKR